MITVARLKYWKLKNLYSLWGFSVWTATEEVDFQDGNCDYRCLYSALVSGLKMLKWCPGIFFCVSWYKIQVKLAQVISDFVLLQYCSCSRTAFTLPRWRLGPDDLLWITHCRMISTVSWSVTWTLRSELRCVTRAVIVKIWSLAVLRTASNQKANIFIWLGSRDALVMKLADLSVCYGGGCHHKLVYRIRISILL